MRSNQTSEWAQKQAQLMARDMAADHRLCTGPCDHGKCIRCGYLPFRDKATTQEHAEACHYRETGPGLDYTANPSCEGRTWHHLETWCDTCKGVA